MNRSESIAKLTEALCKAQATMKHAKKDSENPHFRSKYADLSAVVDAIRMPLSDNGLAYMQTCDIPENGQGVILETILTHISGEWVTSRLFLPVPKFDPQGIGSAITYGKRYSLAAITGLATDDDDDGNGATGKDTAKQTKDKPAATSTADPDSPMPKANQDLYNELSAYCTGDLEQMNTVLKRVTYYKTLDKETGEEKEYSFGLERLPKASEKWAGKALTALKKLVAAEASAVRDPANDTIPY